MRVCAGPRPMGMGRGVVGRPCAVAPPRPPPPPPLPMFEADSQHFASAPSVPRGFTIQNVRFTFGGDHRGTLGGGGVPAKPPFTPPPFPPSDPLPPPPFSQAGTPCLPPWVSIAAELARGSRLFA